MCQLNQVWRHFVCMDRIFHTLKTKRFFGKQWQKCQHSVVVNHWRILFLQLLQPAILHTRHLWLTPQCWIVVYWYEEENQYLSCLMQTKLVCQTVYHYPHLFACQYWTTMEDYGPSTYKCSHFLESFEIICKMQTFDILWKGNKIAKFKFGQKWHVGSIWIKNFKKIDYCSK